MGPGGLPLDQQVLKTMRDRLGRARYASGLLPTETELVREFRSCVPERRV